MAEKENEQGKLFDLTNDNRASIKGFPELRWTGKKPFTTVQFYPAQLKEVFGKPASDGWINKIFWGDNLQVMSHLLKDFRGKIDLIYIDPPFDSKADYKKTIKLRGQEVQNDSSVFEEKQYGDIWTNDEYLQFMYERLLLMRELLSDSGSIYLHCDWHRSSYLRLLMDEVFGPNHFQNDIIWRYSGWNKKNSTFFNRRHDDILFYSKTDNPYFEPFRMQWNSPEEYAQARKQKILVDETNGKKYVLSDGGNGTRVKRYLDEAMQEGRHIDDVWFLDKLNNSDKEGVNYPTQKPERLIERIIESSSPKNGLVFDCFMGSGTTQTVALRMGRRFIGADINLGAIQTTKMRLLKEMDKTDLTNPIEKPGFEVLTVNNYDFFRNPVEAKQIVIKLLELQPFASGNTFDGEKDGRLYKLMPLTRIATKADLSSLVSNLPYDEYDRRMKEDPSEPVARITLVCMGHEPDLLGALKQETQKYNLDLEIHDILLEDKDIVLKRDSEANVCRENGKLVIKSFYPMNLLQKLNMLPESVKDWKQLVDSVFIDWNYDGNVFRPTLPDVPEDEKLLVRGEYEIPSTATSIRVKITDLLSESIEVDVK
jgi:site-specific DNA-methyltransferase (adenine-specific)